MTAPRVLDVVVPLESEALARHTARALAVEAASSPRGTTVRIEGAGLELRLHFEADDTRALRAAANSYLRIAEVAIGVARAALGMPPKP